jgi:hypothetical protein
MTEQELLFERETSTCCDRNCIMRVPILEHVKMRNLRVYKSQGKMMDYFLEVSNSCMFWKGYQCLYA